MTSGCACARPYRAWVNCPSTHQVGHEWHGGQVLAYDEPSGAGTTIYFLEGLVVSALLPTACLVRGWHTIR